VLIYNNLKFIKLRGGCLLPVFKEYIQFLKDKTNNDKELDILSEGYYWVDRQIIKVFDSKGNLHKLLKINIDKDLNMTIKPYKKPYTGEIESWNQTYIRLKDHLDELEKESLALLTKNKNNDRIIIDTNSTGKDSMVKTHIAKKAGLEFTTYFNVTTCDVKDSNMMAKTNGYEFIYPEKKLKGFYNYRKKDNIIPSRIGRFCCTLFKENPTINNFNPEDKLLFLFGMRNDESSSRSGYEDIWVNEKWGKRRDWIGILPIRKWTDLDIWLYILKEKIEINTKYKKGYSRVGCGIVCPNYGKSTWVLDQYWYPTMYERWQRILKEDFLLNFKWISVHCTLNEYLQGAWTGGLLRPEPTKEVIEEFAEYKGVTYDIASKYFGKYCVNECKSKTGKLLKIKNKDTLAMNLKMFGRNIDKFMCKKCLMKELNIDEDRWNEYIRNFKEFGCDLF
jgi:3'-phosphoadenosine 5'-phosphosulfate sulfotransferase (PAPS reductase)/FAD synthetase